MIQAYATANARKTRFDLDCFHCRSSFDAFEATWCECVVREATIVCPHCSRCFCSAPQPYKAAFLQKAPAALLKRRIQSLRDDSRISEQPEQSPSGETESSDSPLVLVVDDSRTIRAAA